ncbi:MAG: hypothetical protein U0031_11470 [Thermomicrobiales bacterium]
MIIEHGGPAASRIDEAVAELQALIISRYPEATFSVSEGDDPEGVYLTATVDVDDMTEVVSVFLDRLVDFQVDEELPIFVVPIRPLGRSMAILTAQSSSRNLASR